MELPFPILSSRKAHRFQFDQKSAKASVTREGNKTIFRVSDGPLYGTISSSTSSIVGLLNCGFSAVLSRWPEKRANNQMRIGLVEHPQAASRGLNLWQHSEFGKTIIFEVGLSNLIIYEGGTPVHSERHAMRSGSECKVLFDSKARSVRFQVDGRTIGAKDGYKLAKDIDYYPAVTSPPNSTLQIAAIIS